MEKLVLLIFRDADTLFGQKLSNSCGLCSNLGVFSFVWYRFLSHDTLFVVGFQNKALGEFDFVIGLGLMLSLYISFLSSPRII